MSDSELLSAALKYASLGWHIFPLHQIIRKPDGSAACGCGNEKCASPGKHPRIKWKAGATCDIAQVRAMWLRWPRAGIGLATGPSGLVAFDLDGLTGVETFRHLSGGVRCQTARARTARGAHVFFRGEAPTSSDPVTKLDVRSTGGFVVLAPSPHASGHVYSWEVPPWPLDEGSGAGCGVDVIEPWNVPDPIAECPPALLEYARKKKAARGGRVEGRTRRIELGGSSPGKGSGDGITLPAYLELAREDFGDRLDAMLNAPDWAEVARALACIPADCSMDEWVRVGMALHQASNGSLQWLDLWDKWSSTSKGVGPGKGEYAGRDKLEYSWSNWKTDGGVTLGTLFDLAFRHGYKRVGDNSEPKPGELYPPAPQAAAEGEHPSTRAQESEKAAHSSDHAESLRARPKGLNGHTIDPAASDFFANLNSESDNPLIRLNKEFAVIEDWGGKCRVLSWVPSPIDRGVKVPSFQDFKSFSERFANKYVTVKKTKHFKDGDVEVDEDVQLGAQWLRWTGRRTYRHLELAPNQPAELANGNFNLWQGWGVMPAAGRWDRMRDHIGEILAGGNSEAADYILKWAAWCAQHPEAAALVALVLRGGKGVGKGLFFTSLRAIFGAHGLQIFNRSHLVGSFNAHLRNCLFLFADEAFWAGDKQGESVLKGLITEPIVVIEQKGVDGVAWPNRLKVGMAANARWVVPASADERRYAVFDVADTRQQDLTYFGAIHDELKAGGLAAMLWDLLTLELGGWSPMMVPHTKALQDQKDLSMSPLVDWWHGMLAGDGEMRFEADGPKEWTAHELLQEIKEALPWSRVSAKALGDFVRERGATSKHTMKGNVWIFPKLAEARATFEKQFGSREWKITPDKWGIEK
jgi:Bifunctional DNA primase/polymerase, N-terminal/Primase C terminal 2 (PriCT-2)/Family of unknown function (DUF5906)